MEDHPEVQGLPPSSLEDKQLTLAYQAGDDGAYQAIYDRYFDRVHNVCRRMLPNAQDAQDATQESFLRVYQALGRFNGRYQLGAWITRIATNVCLDHLRAKTRRPASAFSLDEMALENADRIDIDIDTPDEIVIRRAESRRVRRVLAKLPPMHRAAIVLRDFEGLSYEEVAVALRITDCQVKALIHRARQGFKRSWISFGASILLPARWFPRLRKIEPTAKEQPSHSMSSVQQLAEGMTAATGPAASSCSALSQCGSFVAERIAPALAAMAVGAASLAAPVSAGGGSIDDTQADAGTAVELPSLLDVSSRGESVKISAAGSDRDGRDDDSRTATTGSNGNGPAPVPTASPSPSPAPSPSGSPTSGPPGDSSGQSVPSPATAPTLKPSPPAFAASIGFNSSEAAVVPSSNTVSLGCLSRTFEQTIVTKISNGSVSYNGTLDLRSSSSGAHLELTVASGGRNYTYLSWGAAPTATWTPLDRGTELVLSGEYGPAHGSNPEEAGLPRAGSFEARLVLSCSDASVSSETVTLFER